MRPDQPSEDSAGVVLGSLDRDLEHDQLASEAGFSRAQFYRNVKQSLGHPPMAIRKRLLLERAAYQLLSGTARVTEIAFCAGFESLEGFSRGFNRHFGTTPKCFRRLAPTDYWLGISERVHYVPSSEVTSPRQGELNMKLLERLIRHHGWSMHEIIDASRNLSDADLDQDLGLRSPFPWNESPVTLRSMIIGNAGFARPWLSTINDEKLEYDEQSPDGLKQGVDMNCDRFLELAQALETEGRWDLTFVDSECEPPEVFSYLGVAAAVVTFNAYHRVLLIGELKKRGIDGLGFGDPLDFDPGRR